MLKYSSKRQAVQYETKLTQFIQEISQLKYKTTLQKTKGKSSDELNVVRATN